MSLTPASDQLSHGIRPAHVVLLVDDEPQACKWFARLYGDEFSIWTAQGASEALKLLSQRGGEVAVLVSDFRMPGMNGVELLQMAQSRYPTVVGILVSAYADKTVAMAAVNTGHVHTILEKPLDELRMRQALRDALALSVQRTQDKALLAQRAASQREILGFLAHEVTSPLATVRGYLEGLRERVIDEGQPGGSRAGMACLRQHQPGEVIRMLDAAHRRAAYTQSLVSTFVQTARDAAMSALPLTLKASDLLRTVVDEYPFDEGQVHCLRVELMEDFNLPGRQDLIYLVLCTLIKNALQAMAREPASTRPDITLRVGRASVAPGLCPQPTIQVLDNGPGMPAEVLARVTRAPVASGSGGSGMGLLFCQRVMTSLGGSIEVQSGLGAGSIVSLFFPRDPSELTEEST